MKRQRACVGTTQLRISSICGRRGRADGGSCVYVPQHRGSESDFRTLSHGTSQINSPLVSSGPLKSRCDWTTLWDPCLVPGRGSGPVARSRRRKGSNINQQLNESLQRIQQAICVEYYFVYPISPYCCSTLESDTRRRSQQEAMTPRV
ncbi:unnamed protein product [Pleuronectes platessa]|uniref:Uncharacterized protein n=1 Tax=Pleuronectes platessa TaxID=8262 RepID=A0A9N7UGE6_PLEPL|nr:unnamed protein product [Pleuronectes platessa]